MNGATTSRWTGWPANAGQLRARLPRDDRRRLGWSFRLAEISGIEIDVHVTFLVLLAGIVFHHLASGDGLGAAARGLALTLAVFAIVVLHELGHALAAARFGIRTRDIILLPIGGLARLERIPEKPLEEALVAIAGPAVNVALACAIGGAIVAAGGHLAVAELQEAAAPFVHHLFWINAAMAIFNLMPAFPMDGGRVLRASLSSDVGRLRGTEVAVAISRQMAILFALVGVVASPMLVLVAFFVWIAAEGELELVRAPRTGAEPGRREEEEIHESEHRD